ncbi:MAG: glutamate-5-semialdehyde dehydrogenase, partial [Actinomycetota bacterium]|nr:glutamate-5-semialdehyde dehydrogenase [Actinomycetota bacterium]
MPTEIDPTVVAQVGDVARRAGAAARQLALLSRTPKDDALLAIADALVAGTEVILEANREDQERGRARGLADGLLDRLLLDGPRVAAIAQAVRDIAALPDPVGEVVRGTTLANGLEIRQLRVPMGVVGMIYEARPNVTVDAAALTLKSGNAVILRGGSAAGATNRALVAVMRTSLERQGISADAISLLDAGGHDAARALMTARGLVDLVIPRGGAALIQTVVTESTVPVIETGVGVNHVYVDRAADLDKALAVVLNAKTHRPSVCNAAESLLVHRDVAGDFLPKVITDLTGAGVRLHVAAEVQGYAAAAGAAYDLASEADFATEWHGLEMSVAVVDDLDDALGRIRQFGTGHTEAIVTDDRSA